MITTWTAAAAQAAEEARELGFAAAGGVAAAWCARCLPDATRCLLRAASVLTGGEAVQCAWEQADPCPSGEAFLQGAEELEAGLAVLAKHAGDMAAACESARDRAVALFEAARGNADEAEARAQMDAARQVIADCEAALDILGEVLQGISDAVALVRQVPDDFAQAYDVPLQFIADGGTLPWSGDFLTGTFQPAEVITTESGG